LLDNFFEYIKYKHIETFLEILEDNFAGEKH
jgi:hypothetical protein